MDVGLAVVIGAVLIFYLRLILLQRERVKRITQPASQDVKKSKKGKTIQNKTSPRYSILSQKRSNLVIGGVGLLAMLAGVALTAGWINFPLVQDYWWLPTAFGIVAFSWAFSL